MRQRPDFVKHYLSLPRAHRMPQTACATAKATSDTRSCLAETPMRQCAKSQRPKTKD